MTMKFDVLIVGGGMVGAALACALGDSRLKVGVLDSRAPAESVGAEYDLRVSAITLASRQLFENLGAWDSMRRRRVSPVEAMHIWQDAGALHFDAADIGEACLAYIVENRAIQQALVERMHGFTNVHGLWPVEVVDIVPGDEAATVTLKDGRTLAARLLVGADGADSAVRRALGAESWRHDLAQQAIVATVRTELPHARTAFQHFLPTGPLAFLPLDEPNTCSIVWSADTARAQALLALDDAAFTAELETAFGKRLGRVLSISQRQAFPLALSHVRTYTAARAALVGDAAHSVHPLAGQGVNLGLLDAAVLSETILDAVARERDIGSPARLRRYERARKGDNMLMLAVTGGFRYLFGADMPALRGIRTRGLALVDSLAPLKRSIMRRAAGLDGDLPALARWRHSVAR